VTEEDIFYIGVKLIILDCKGRMLLLRSHPNADKETYWDVPGGRIRKGESVRQTLQREIYEETKLRIEDEAICFVGFDLTDVRISIGKGNIGLVLLIFKCKYADTPQIHLSPEHSSYWWATPEEALLEHPSGISAHLLQQAIKECK
jgi:8-oxo-dGTP pyrophosphatase MutT (NUDIX family)